MDWRHVHVHPTAGPKPLVFAKMEALVREMQEPENGVPIRSQKWIFTSIPSSFMGYDLIEWLMDRLDIEDSAEAIHLANLLCQYGYFFPVGESRSLIVKDDSSLYRFQTPYYWPSQNHSADSTDYAIYLTKRLSRNKQKHGLEDYELEAYNKLKKTLSHKWDFVTMQADEQVKLAKDRKKGDKIVTDSQERAYWRVYRPPPGFTNCLEMAPVPDKTNMANRVRKKTVDDLKKDNEFLLTAVGRTRQKVSQAGENLLTHFDTYAEYDPMLSCPLPSNPWISDENTYWILNSPKVDTLTEKRVRRWGISVEELLSDPTGKEEFTNYLRKEYCHENIRFWEAANELRWGPASNVSERVQNIYEEFLKPGAPCEINIDGKTMEQTQLLMKQPTRFTFDLAAEHVYVLLLKKDCYPRFLRSDMYKNLIATAIPLTSHRRRFFNFVPGKKKPSTTSAPNNITLSQTPQPLKRHGSDEQTSALGGVAPHGSSSSVGDEGGLGIHIGGPSTTANKLDCDPPYRGDLPSARYVGHCNTVGLSYAAEKKTGITTDVSQSNTVCPWESNTESSSANICPWETSAPPPSMQSQQSSKGSEQRLSHLKSRPDRSKSVDVSSLGKRHGSVSVAPSLVPVLAEGQPTTTICPWENQELPNRTTEKSKSIDVDVCPWEVSEPVKKASTSSAPGMVTADTTNVPSSTALQAHAEQAEKPSKSSSPGTGTSITSRERGNKDSSRPTSERRISIQVCPWEKVEEEVVGAETHSTCIVSDKPHGRRPSDTGESRLEQATKPKEKYVIPESQAHPESIGMQMALEPGQGIGSEGTSSPSSTCSSSSHSDSRRIKIDYTVRSGHFPGQYGLSIYTTPAENVMPPTQHTVHGHIGATLSSGNTSTSSSSSAGGAAQTTKAESPRATGSLPCPVEGGSKPSSPKMATNVVAPWEDNPPQKMTDICPWEDEESCKVDTPFVKTYATLGYL